MEALILPKAIQLRIDRSLSGPSPAKLCDIGMVDLIFGERRGKNVEIVLRVGAGQWDRAHIEELSDLRGASPLDELVGGSGGLADGVDRHGIVATETGALASGPAPAFRRVG